MTVCIRVRLRWLVLAALLGSAGAAVAADYWVANGGDDGTDGLTPATAWDTLGHAASVVDPGDTVHVQDGSYQGFYLSRSGLPGNPITFVAEDNAATITADNGTTPDGINVEGAAHVVIDGFVVNNRTRAGIRVALSQFVTVRNCRAGHNGRWGIFSGFADDFVIEDNETHHSQLEHGIYVSNSGDRPVIRRNLVYSNHANGIHMNGDLSQGGDGVISDAVVEENVIYDNGGGGGSAINMDGVTDSVVRNNLMFDNHASGISLYRIDGGSGSSGNLVINNTILNAADGRWCVNINTGSTNNTVLNNILYNEHSFRGVITIDSSSRPGFVSDYNSVMERFSIDDGDTVIDLAAWQSLGYDLHSILATPAELFVAPGTDHHLRIDAPAGDAGTLANAPATDLDGAPRPVGGGVDIGAYELQLLECNDGDGDPGEECGEPGLACSDPCTACAACICAATTPVCGDALVCGAEQCESDSDCAPAEVCAGCACVNPPICASGIEIARARLRLRADPFFFRIRGEAVIPKPWQALDPIANGIRLVVDALSGPGGVDVTVPAGAFSNGVGWKINGRGTRWTYADRQSIQGSVVRAVIRDKSAREDGLVRFVVKGRGTAGLLPDVAAVRTAVVLGAPSECASYAWNGPGDPRPRCDGDSSRIVCR